MRDKQEKYFAIALVVLLYAGMQAMGITCPIRFLTGISCAGCGMTRAWLSVLRLDLAGAFSYHPLFWTIPFILVWYKFRKKIGHERVIEAALVSIFLIVYGVRMHNIADTVVVCNIKDGFIYKAVRYFLSAIFEGRKYF